MNERKQIMRAKEYIACSEASLKHPAEIFLRIGNAVLGGAFTDVLIILFNPGLYTRCEFVYHQLYSL